MRTFHQLFAYVYRKEKKNVYHLTYVNKYESIFRNCRAFLARDHFFY